MHANRRVEIAAISKMNRRIFIDSLVKRELSPNICLSLTLIHCRGLRGGDEGDI